MKKLFLICAICTSKLFSQSLPVFKWVNGGDTVNQLGVYGLKGTPAISNIPGSRCNSVSWVDQSGNLWLFGGQGTATTSATGYLNDLWKYDLSSNMWTWIAGTSTIQSQGVYGTIGVPSSTNYPGARQNANGWVDNSGNLWLFGGQGFASGPAFTYLNDLWKFNISTNQWTWMLGANSGTPASVYGTQGISAGSNTPGGRFGASSWIDNSNNLWLFGGQQISNTQRLNDLWKYSISTNQWTWISGANTINQNGSYGTKGVASSTNIPGARQASVAWKDQSNNFWLFGGDGMDVSGTTNNYLNDLWKYDVSNNTWTWISGSNTYSASAVYGTMGTASASNIPGARQMSIGWYDNNDLWMFGAWGYIGPPFGRINDLWKYNITSNQWTWMGGQNIINQPGIYGTQGVAAPANIPGARRMSVAWKDTNGKLWLFGGSGIDKNNKTSNLNDLWQIDIGSTTFLRHGYTDNEISIFPNPSKEFIEVSLIKDDVKKLEVYSANGQLLIISDECSNRLNIKELGAGAYIIKITTYKKIIIKPFLKEN